MRRRRLHQVVCCVLLIVAGLILAASSALADELILKNGQKITGTIVGYENDMFRVETEFGFMLVRKDKVATINVTPGGPGKPTEAGKTPKAKPEIRQVEKTAAAGPSAAPNSVNAPPPAVSAPPSDPRQLSSNR